MTISRVLKRVRVGSRAGVVAFALIAMPAALCPSSAIAQNETPDNNAPAQTFQQQLDTLRSGMSPEEIQQQEEQARRIVEMIEQSNPQPPGNDSSGSADDAQTDEGIVIINQDGEVVDGAQLEQQPLNRQVENIPEGSSVRLDGNRILITGPEGEKREIDISGARSISVRQSIQSVNEDGEQKTVRNSKAVIVDRDGNRVEVPLTEMGGDINIRRFAPNMIPGIAGDAAMMPGGFMFRNGESSPYRIGIFTKPVGEQLRAHVELEEGIGLVVESLTPDGPSDQAGLQKHDILIYADDTMLGTVENLTHAIEVAGEEENSLSIIAMRNGQEITLEVTPEKTPESERNGARQFFKNRPMAFEFREIGPGLIIGGTDLEMPEGDDHIRDLQQQMQEQIRRVQEEHLKQLEEHRELMEKMFDRERQRMENGGGR